MTLSDEERMAYALAEEDERYRVGATARSKLAVIESICAEAIERHEPTLVIGQYLDQLDEIGRRLQAPVLTGKTPVREREKLFQAFRMGEIKVLVVSKVANFSIDLPEASVAVQVSGTFGSRQEEAQRLGRILRPEEGRPPGPVFCRRFSGHERPGVRHAAPTLPGRARLRLPHSRRGNPRLAYVRSRSEEAAASHEVKSAFALSESSPPRRPPAKRARVPPGPPRRYGTESSRPLSGWSPTRAPEWSRSHQRGASFQLWYNLWHEPCAYLDHGGCWLTGARPSIAARTRQPPPRQGAGCFDPKARGGPGVSGPGRPPLRGRPRPHVGGPRRPTSLTTATFPRK